MSSTDQPTAPKPDSGPEPTRDNRLLAAVERAGNALPDPAVLFIALLGIVMLLSWLLSGIDFGLTDPRNGEELRVRNLMSG